ncbi:hypothetical protein DBR06_SOUSAS18110045 [Sousa chinensis]|nr:hypothetical protein DBR06_SOUSAS18110045 [Sousa chinensis]
MPQLDTSTRFTTISSMFLTLFIIFQLKVSKYTYYPNPESTLTQVQKQSTP